MRACARMWIAFAFVCAPAQAQPDHGASVASAAPIREGPILPWYVAPDAPTIGVFDIVLGEPFAATVARSTFPFRPESGLGGEYADGVAEGHDRRQQVQPNLRPAQDQQRDARAQDEPDRHQRRQQGQGERDGDRHPAHEHGLARGRLARAQG